MLDESGRLRRVSEFAYLEFYLTLVRHGTRRPPALTPRLFSLQEGHRLYVSPHATGRYTIRPVSPECNVFFFATGTGEAPHNGMIVELLARGHTGQIVGAVSVRKFRDAAYRACHEELARRFPNYHYFLSATREPAIEAVAVVSSRRLQDAVTSGQLERETGVQLDAARTHVFLCGNPAMIGLSEGPQVRDSTYQLGSMLDVLLQRGFRVDEHGRMGNLHFERYW
jgi:ferredoxin--NADP+ reductase